MRLWTRVLLREYILLKVLQAQYSGIREVALKSIVRVALLLAAYGAKMMLASPEGLQ